MRDLREVLEKHIKPALALLPEKMSRNPEAVYVQLLATTLQEDPNATQVQQPRVKGGKPGPARGVYQFEKGGGVKGVFTHPSTKGPLLEALKKLGYEPSIDAVYSALEGTDDVLDSVLARLLYWASPKAMPRLGDVDGAFQYYIENWRPGAYTNGTAVDQAKLRAKWASNYMKAMEVVK